MTIVMLRFIYLLAKRGGIPLAIPRSSSFGFRRATSAHGQGDLRITVRAYLSSASPRASHSSSASHHLVFPDELTGTSDRAGPIILFEAPAEVLEMMIRLCCLHQEDWRSPSQIPMFSQATGGLQPSPECSRLDNWFLGPQADNRLRFHSSKRCMSRCIRTSP